MPLIVWGDRSDVRQLQRAFSHSGLPPEVWGKSKPTNTSKLKQDYICAHPLHADLIQKLSSSIRMVRVHS